jgi:broad specificity phosphatase PhoE
MAPPDRFPNTRDEAPAYLARYQSRRSTHTEAPESAGDVTPDDAAPPYVARARARAAERALLERAVVDSPPSRTAAYARVTVSPREIIPPPSFRSRLAGTVDVRLIRHGETQGYSADGGLTPLGRWQAHRKGQDLSRGVHDDSVVRVVHADTARARETALGVHEGLVQGMARYGISASVEAPIVDDIHFGNFRIQAGDQIMDPTQAFDRYARILEGHERTQSGDRPGWLVEMERFWNIQAAGGDPITYWLTMPLQCFEPAALVVRRFWAGIVAAVRATPSAERVLVCTHSGCIRAVATAAVGHDPGEPHNVEDVRIRVYPDCQHAIVTYRGRGLEIEIPTTAPWPWGAPA